MIEHDEYHCHLPRALASRLKKKAWFEPEIGCAKRKNLGLQDSGVSRSVTDEEPFAVVAVGEGLA